MIERILNAAVGPIKGRYIDQTPTWLWWALVLPVTAGLGIALAHFGMPLLHSMTDRELLECILIFAAIGALRR